MDPGAGRGVSMSLFNLFGGGFSHGVHPAGHKEQTVDRPIQRVPFMDRYVMPLGQHIGALARPLVSAGEQVRRGQMIAEAGA
ncbi:MAG: hypothetical protein B0D88_05715, partial [Candidatus Sedimenticola endophacoides]